MSDDPHDLVRRAGAQIGELTWRRQQAEDDKRVKEALHRQLAEAQGTITTLRNEVHRFHGAKCECALCPQLIIRMPRRAQ